MKDILSVQNLLLQQMREGIYRDAKMLPAENVLAESLAISRTQLRDSLSQLEREGFITRRHGVGTVINRHVLNVKVRADIELEFLGMIENSGYQAEERFLRVERLAADAKIAGIFGLEEGEAIMMVSRLALADGKPTIYCEDYFPCKLIRMEDYPARALEEPIFTFLKEYCGVDVYLDLTDIHPVLADADLAERLNVEVGSPLLFMDEQDYDINGAAVLYSRQYYIDGVIKHTLMRKKF